MRHSDAASDNDAVVTLSRHVTVKSGNWLRCGLQVVPESDWLCPVCRSLPFLVVLYVHIKVDINGSTAIQSASPNHTSQHVCPAQLYHSLQLAYLG